MNARLALALLSALVAGCSAAPKYALETSWPHKDVAILSITLDERLAAQEYIEIAEAEAKSLSSQAAAVDIPLFRIQCEFFRRVRDDDASDASDAPSSTAESSSGPEPLHLERLADVQLYADGSRAELVSVY